MQPRCALCLGGGDPCHYGNFTTETRRDKEVAQRFTLGLLLWTPFVEQLNLDEDRKCIEHKRDERSDGSSQLPLLQHTLLTWRVVLSQLW